MFLALQVATVLLVSIAWAQSLAHALELPGKMRLSKDAYASVQSIYYPGFTIGGLGEGLGILATVALLMASEGPMFSWTLIALVALLAMHAIYWLVTHPVNKFWVKDQALSRLGAGFFAIGRPERAPKQSADDLWQELRNRWEYSHVARAVCAGVALLSLIIAVAI
jgi:hypothetical protein